MSLVFACGIEGQDVSILAKFVRFLTHPVTAFERQRVNSLTGWNRQLTRLSSLREIFDFARGIRVCLANFKLLPANRL
jgi:hypothetical protein